MRASRVILATGGKALPKSGSDGQGYTLAQAMGHSLTPEIFPALVPLLLPADHFIRQLSGLTLPTTLTLYASSGKRLISFENSTLCTHFGLSGPSVLDISRYLQAAQLGGDKAAHLRINWLPHTDAKALESAFLQAGKISLLKFFEGQLPERLLRALCTSVGVEAGDAVTWLTREQRQALVRALCDMPLPIAGNRGFTYAEVTAGGVPLQEIYLETMQSRLCEGLYFCGEICDVDGRIGGFNFQWAWASGYVAGISAGG